MLGLHQMDARVKNVGTGLQVEGRTSQLQLHYKCPSRTAEVAAPWAFDLSKPWYSFRWVSIRLYALVSS